MTNYNMTHTEITLMEKLQKLLQLDPELAEDLLMADMAPETLYDPADARYILDQQNAELRHNLIQAEHLLRSHLDTFVEQGGTLLTQTTELWERYPMDAMLRMLWRMREIDGETSFMRGNAGITEPAVIWYVTIDVEADGNRALRCYDTERRNYMYLLLDNQYQDITREKFFEEMKDFLRFPEDAVWISAGTNFKVLEVDYEDP